MHFFDLYDRTVVSYEVGNHNNNILVFNTFDKAIQANKDAHPLCHSDYAERKNYTEVLDTSNENSLILRYSIPVNPDYKDLLLL